MEDKEIKIDYLSVTFPLIVEADDNELAVVLDTVKMISNYLNVNFMEVNREDYSTLRYKYQYALGDSMTLRLSGPENDTGYRTCHLEFKGEGCRDFERRNQDKTWKDLFLYLMRLNGTFKRIDVAIDDYSGEEMPLRRLYDKIKIKQYTSIFNKPPRPIGFIETGLSLTFGSTKSPTQLCVYDKKIEQINKGKEIAEDYWVRYEMRFRDDRANAIVYNLLTDYYDTNELQYGFNMRLFAFEMLYSIIDIKEDNIRNTRNQGHKETDQSWTDFLGGVKKGIIKNPDEKIFSYESSFNYIEPKAAFYLMVRLAQCKANYEIFFYEMLKVLYKLSDFDKKKLKRFNMFLYQMNLKPYTDEEFAALRTNLFLKIEEMEMPF